MRKDTKHDETVIMFGRKFRIVGGSWEDEILTLHCKELKNENGRNSKSHK
jgi:hypothetical protein